MVELGVDNVHVDVHRTFILKEFHDLVVGWAETELSMLGAFYNNSQEIHFRIPPWVARLAEDIRLQSD